MIYAVLAFVAQAGRHVLVIFGLLHLLNNKLFAAARHNTHYIK